MNPSGWQMINFRFHRLGDIATVDKNSLSNNTDPDYTFTYISLSDIDNGKIATHLKEMRFANSPSRARKLVENNDIIMATVRPNLKAFYIIKKNADKYVVSTGFAVISAKKGYSPDYIYQYIFSSHIEQQINALVTGSNYPAINSTEIKNLNVYCPPLPEQRKIAEILSSWDKAIALLEQLITAKCKLKQGLMQQLLTRKKRFNGFEGSEWAEKELGEVTIITRLAGAEYSSVWKEDENGEIIALRGFNIGKNRIIEKNLARISNELSLKLNRSRLYIGDVVYPCVGTIGNAAVIDENDKYHIQQNIAKLTPIQTIISSYYLAYYLMSRVGLNEVLRFNASSSQPNVLVGSLRKYRIPVPPLPEQQKIASILSAADTEIFKLEKQLAAYKQQKRGLMQQLLTGKKRV